MLEGHSPKFKGSLKQVVSVIQFSDLLIATGVTSTSIFLIFLHLQYVFIRFVVDA